jgi:dipeptidyl aminopeptidase/acylaminoacyl peptidase
MIAISAERVIPATIPHVSEEACPVEVAHIPTEGGRTTTIVTRCPPGDGPFPAMIHLHGGLNHQPDARLVEEATWWPTHNRFLAAGYLIAEPTFADRNVDPLSDDALRDCVHIVEYVRRLPGVDPRSVVIWGDSGGGSLALELAGEVELCAIVPQEPATVLLTGIYSVENLTRLGAQPPFLPQHGRSLQEHPWDYYTPELQQRTRERLARVRCPVLIAHGDVHPLKLLNLEAIVPELRRLGKDVEVIVYPGQRHGFSRAIDSTAAAQFFADSDAFFKRHLPVQPTPIDPALVSEIPTGSAPLSPPPY